MALTVVEFVLIATFVALFNNGGSRALRIETVPEPFNERIDTQLNISCIPDGPDHWAKQIQTLQVVKDDKSIAVIRWSGLVKGPGSKPNMQAEGNIEKDALRSFLRVTINKPDKNDIGTYTCLMFYEDEDFQLREEKSSTNVTVDNKDLSSIVTYLFEKVVSLEKASQDQETELKQQKTVISKQEEALKQQRQKVSGLEHNLLKQQKYTRDLENTIQEQGKQLMDQNIKGMNQSLKLQEMFERETFSVAFSAYGTKSTTFNDGETLKFNKYMMNIGNHYDLNTGVFTTPKSGLYVFHLSVWTKKNDNAWIQLKVNDVTMTELVARDADLHDQSSVSMVVSLQEGDRVWPYFAFGAVLGDTSNKFTVFNGYLLKLL